MRMASRKILIITNRIPYPLNDGGNLAMQAMIDGYHNNGWQVYLLSMNTSRHHLQHDLLRTLFKQLYRFEWFDFNNDITSAGVIKNFLLSKQAEHVERFYNEAFEQKITDVLADFKPDAIQIESVYLTTYLPAVKRCSNTVTILRVHNLEYRIWRDLANKTRSPLKRTYLLALAKRLRKFELAAWPQYDVVLAITEKDATSIIKHANVPGIMVAPFGLDASFTPPVSADEQWVGYHIGAMDWIPNRESVEWFLKNVWPKLHAAVPDFEFHFAGRKMPAEMGNLNIPGVYCHMEVPDANAFIAGKKILIVPITAAGGIRVKILEAMGAGKIVITTPYGIKGIEAHAGEHYLLATTAEDFVRAVKWCMNNREKAEQVAANARKLIAEHYNNTTIMSGIMDRIEETLRIKL
jgi:glycosyltransferase involved in cell wall biosynthesis